MTPFLSPLRCAGLLALLAWSCLAPAQAAQTDVTAIHAFAGGDLGERPVTLLAGPDGKLYGASGSRQQGNPSDIYGTLFRLNQDGTGYEVLHAFRPRNANSFATSPYLLLGSDGNIYGYASNAGRASLNGLGLLFQITPSSGAVTILHEFTAADGNINGMATNANGFAPAGLVEQNGMLYGVARSGGAAGRGTAFRFDPTSRAFTLLHTFNVTDTLTNPSQLAIDATGMLVGMSGSRPFQLHPAGGVREIAASAPANGISLGSVSLGPGTQNGFLGSSTGGQHSMGALFSLRLNDTPAYDILHSFDKGMVAGLNPGTDPVVNIEGRSPGGLTSAGDGSLYGYGTQGGVLGSGTLFRFLPDAGKLEVKYTFPFTLQHTSGFSIPLNDVTPNATGAYPLGALTQGADGAWYGVASHGGSHGLGTVYRVVFGTDDAGAKPDISRWEMLLMEGQVQPDGSLAYARPWGDPYSWPGDEGEIWVNSGYTAAIDWASIGATECTGETATEPAANSGLLSGGVGSIYGAYAVDPVQPWSGAKPDSGRFIFFLDQPGSYTYTLRCRNAAGEVARSVRIEARGVPQPGEPGVPEFGNGGGGAIAMIGLLLAGVAAWRRQRSRPGAARPF